MSREVYVSPSVEIISFEMEGMIAQSIIAPPEILPIKPGGPIDDLIPD
ncbi:MAG: hypothetical protein MJZ33_00220 [Paludibacteraceae bacterium]|nr:hypothetical protein [Paludibacteraceae bacterium]